MSKPTALNDEQLSTLMTVTRALAPRYRCWLLTAVVAELADTANVQQAVCKALERMMREQVPA
jgi:hypothetical protein